jgi:SdrD B-like domain
VSLSSGISTYMDNDSSGTITFNDALQYQFTVTNIGDTSLSSVHVTDNSFGMTITCPATTLAASASMTCTAAPLHTITLSEANGGSVTQVSTALSAYAGKSYTKSATLVTPISQNPDIQMVKNLASYDDHDSSSSITAADGLWYQFTITNSGNVSLTNISVTDNTFAIPVTCPVTSLSPTASTICAADTAHIITGAESSAGQVSNTATGSGKFNNSTYTDSNTLITVVIPVPLGTISGQVREDSDGDGDLLDPDPGIAGVTVYLTDSTNTVTLDTTTTDPGGTFTFNNLLAGMYIIHETDPSGFASTADSNGANDNQVPVTLASGETRSDIAFLDKADTPACTAPDPANGFVASTNPANGAVNVSMTTTEITITYNQPMMDTGGQSVDRVDKYAFTNQTSNKPVDIVGVTYNPATYTATITIDTTDLDWQAGNLYEVTIKTVQNACGTSQSSVTRTFTTE